MQNIFESAEQHAKNTPFGNYMTMLKKNTLNTLECACAKKSLRTLEQLHKVS